MRNYTNLIPDCKIELGKIHLNKLNEALRKWDRVLYAHFELTNDIDNNGTITESKSFWISSDWVVPQDWQEKVIGRLNTIFSMINNQLDAKSLKWVLEQLNTGQNELLPQLPIRDNRTSKEELLKELEKRKIQAVKAAEQDSVNDKLKARWAYPKFVVLTEEYWTMGGDYGDTHRVASYILSNGYYSVRNMADFNNAVNKCPSLKNLKWEKHKVRGAHVYNYEIKAESGHTHYCGDNCRDEYVKGKCPGHKTTYVVSYGYNGDAVLPIYPDLKEAEVITAGAGKGNGGNVKGGEPGGVEADLRRNEVMNGLEVRFKNGGAPADIIAKLKGLGFKWAFRRKYWYKKGYTDELKAQVSDILGIGNKEAADTSIGDNQGVSAVPIEEAVTEANPLVDKGSEPEIEPPVIEDKEEAIDQEMVHEDNKASLPSQPQVNTDKAYVQQYLFAM